MNNETYLLSEIDSGIETNIVFNVMPPPSNRFTGRADYLKKLGEHFGIGVDQLRYRKSFLLYGMGGVGKTQICLKFVEESSDW